MPYKPKAQQRKFHAILNAGEISPKTVKEFDQSTDYSHLPEKKSKKKKKHAALDRASSHFAKHHMKQAMEKK